LDPEAPGGTTARSTIPMEMRQAPTSVADLPRLLASAASILIEMTRRNRKKQAIGIRRRDKTEMLDIFTSHPIYTHFADSRVKKQMPDFCSVSVITILCESASYNGPEIQSRKLLVSHCVIH
jgi:hypothetical protein